MISFTAFSEKVGHSRLMPQKSCDPTQEDLVRRFMATVLGGTDDKIRVLCRVRIPLIWPQVVFSGMKNADIFHLLKRAQRYCYVSPLRQKQDPAPPGCTIVSWLLLPCPCTPSLPAGTQERSWRLKSVPDKQEMGDTEKTSVPGAPQGPAQFHHQDSLMFHHSWDSETAEIAVWKLMALVGLWVSA